ncbi:JAB domain-containing protein [Nitrospira moscoviensis]|uniref:MPN domain-containing protein n=1 Tax=Nitrospira moscoviensis TaxID=42253 RepID=A0A0K2GGF3_NITMO|nr:hypothetical protein NITMOv2_3629 [Nitrospira moscoviensis]
MKSRSMSHPGERAFLGTTLHAYPLPPSFRFARLRPPSGLLSLMPLQANATALTAAHNHPSGVTEPSESDRLLTRDLIAACQPIGIQVLDHLIVAPR